MGWRRAAVVLAVMLVVPRCTCAPPCSNHQAPHASFDVASGCVGYYCAMNCDPGFANCNNEQTDGCETSSQQAFGTVSTVSGLLGGDGCTITCDPGHFDCDDNVLDGCESTTPCGPSDAGDAGEPKGAHIVATLSTAPRGLVACAGREFFFDGSTLRSIDSTSLQTSTVLVSPNVPADGLACDGAYVYWATLATTDAAAPDGALYRVAIGSKVAEPIATNIDPTSGIDVRDGGAYVVTTSGLAVSFGLDAGVVAWMPASQSAAYKAFTLGASDDWSLDHAAIVRRAADAAASNWIDDAGSPSAILSNADGQPLVVLHTSDDAGGSDLFAYIRDDAGLPAVSAIDASVHPIVATSGGAKVVAASDDTIYVVGPTGITPLYASSDHIVDVTVDGPWVVWTTSNAAAVWRGIIP